MTYYAVTRNFPNDDPHYRGCPRLCVYDHGVNAQKVNARGRYGPYAIYEDRGDAALYRQGLLPYAYNGFTYEVEEVDDLDAFVARNLWMWRERNRFESGEYHPVPWKDEPWFPGEHADHFAHLSVKQPGKLAFTENDAKGIADRQTPISPGRYLTRFYSDVLTPKDIERWACAFSVACDSVGLHFTQDADEIARIYMNGPSSCMSGFGFEDQPARVYAGPDLALAYTGTIESPSGRCVVWPERKIRSTIYGDCERMRMLLDAEGYREGRIDGARIQKIDHPYIDGAYLMPYVDGACGADDHGEFIRLGGSYYETGSTDGHTEGGTFCESCEGRTRGETYTVDGYYTWCESCTDSYAVYCEYAQDYVSGEGETVYSGRGCVTIHTDNLDLYGAVYVEDRMEYWHRDYVFGCESCSEHFHVDDESGDHPGHCESCAEDLEDDDTPDVPLPTVEEAEAAGQERLPLPDLVTICAKLEKALDAAYQVACWQNCYGTPDNPGIPNLFRDRAGVPRISNAYDADRRPASIAA